MNRILKRPMFRMGGSTGTGITSGLPRASYAEGPGPEGVKSTIEKLQEAAGFHEIRLSEQGQFQKQRKLQQVS